MNVAAFVRNLGPTMFFAFIGTFASTFVVGGLVYGAGQMGLCYPLGMLASLLFGSLISATDPVTVLAVFQALGVKVDLFPRDGLRPHLSLSLSLSLSPSLSLSLSLSLTPSLALIARRSTSSRWY